MSNAGGTARLSRLFLVLALVWGVCLRLRMYLMDRALWLDPAALALNLVDTGYAGLFGPLGSYSQAAPVGFLLVSKLIASMFDYRELALTLFPLLLSLAGLGLFVWLAIELLGTKFAAWAVVPFAAGSSAVYYAGEFKPYAGDLFCTVLILLVAVRGTKSEFSRRWSVGFTAVGIVTAWFSFSAIVVTAGCGIALFVHCLKVGKRTSAAALAVAGSAVLLHYLLLYTFQIRPSIAAAVFEYHKEAYAPLPSSWSALQWWRDTAIEYVRFPLGFAGSTALPLLGLTLGVVAAARERGKRLEFGLLLFAPALLVVLSALGRYPLAAGQHDVNGRFLLFTVPISYLLIGMGIRLLLARRASPWVTVVVALFLFYPIVERTVRWPYFIQQEMRALVADLRAEVGPDDEVYVYAASVPAFRFYTRNDPISFLSGRPPANPSSDLARDLGRLAKSGAVWLVVSHDFGRERHYLTQAMTAVCVHDFESAYPGAHLLRFQCGG